MDIETVSSILEEYLEQDQVEPLANVLLSYEDTNSILYEVIGLLNSGISYKDVMADYTAGNIGWGNRYYVKFVEKRQIEDTNLASPPEIRDGEMECPKCKKTKTLVVEMQTRSADEGFTYYIHCFNPRCKVITKT